MQLIANAFKSERFQLMGGVVGDSLTWCEKRVNYEILRTARMPL